MYFIRLLSPYSGRGIAGRDYTACKTINIQYMTLLKENINSSARMINGYLGFIDNCLSVHTIKLQTWNYLEEDEMNKYHFN